VTTRTDGTHRSTARHTHGVTAGGRSVDDEADDLEVIELQLNESQAQRSRRDRPRPTGGRHRRRPIVIAIVVVAALAGSAIVDHSRGSSRKGAAISTSQATQTTPAKPGPLFPFRVGAQILTGGADGLRLVDTDTGRVSALPLSGLPGGPATIVAHSGSTVAVRGGTHLYWFSMPSGIVHAVDGITAFPSARRGYLWIAGEQFAREVPGPGEVVATDGPAVGATRAGLLVATKAGVLLQPAGGTGNGAPRVLLRAPAVVIAVHADRVAWLSTECGVLRCPLHVTEIATGATSSWIQLVRHPTPLAVAGTSAVFSPSGSQLAIVVPTATLASAGTLIVADLRSRATAIIDATDQFNQPARPGSADATGMTVDWTPEGTYLVVAAARGTGRLGIVHPATPLIVPSSATLDTGATAAAIGISSAGPLDLPRRGTTGKIDSGRATPVNLAGLSLVGADTEQVDVLDLGTDQIATWPIGGNPAAGSSTIARVTGGWLVVRGSVVEFLADGGAPGPADPADAASAAESTTVDAGSLVFSSNHGRDAWIAVARGSQLWSVEPYDGATGRVGPAAPVAGTLVGAVGAGLVVISDTTTTSTELDFVDRSGRLHKGPLIHSPTIEVVAAGGTTVAYFDYDGFHVFDVETARDQFVTDRPVLAAALSPDGRNLAWIDDGGVSATTGAVGAMRVEYSTGPADIHRLGSAAERVFVADDGTVLFTSGVSVRRGRVDAAGSSPVYGLAPDPLATLALG
jgi:hypothetical protein